MSLWSVSGETQPLTGNPKSAEMAKCVAVYGDIAVDGEVHFECANCGINIFARVEVDPNMPDPPAGPFRVTIESRHYAGTLSDRFWMVAMVQQGGVQPVEGIGKGCVAKVVEQTNPIVIRVIGGGVSTLQLDISPAD